MTWRASLRDTFGEAVALPDYLEGVRAALQGLDFLPERTFAAVSICRDELTQHLMGEVAARWEGPFSLGGLGGVPSLGRTGWGACLSHVPSRGGRGHLVVFGLPHIGVDAEGGLGASLRHHQDHPTPTCGALSSIFSTFDSPPEPDRAGDPLADAEARRLRMLVSAELDDPPADLVALTRAAAAAVRREMWAELDALDPYDRMDVAVLTGIQIHLPEGSDHVLALTAEVRTAADAAPVALSSALSSALRPRGSSL